MPDLTPCEKIAVYFTGVEADRAIRSLRSYFAPDLHFTGSAFDRLHDGNEPNRFTATDMLAVTTLSVEVPPRAAIRLIESSAVEPLLAEISTAADLWTDPALLDLDGYANQLWALVCAHHDVGRTITSKLLATKRPHLIPIFDRHVQAALGFGDQWPFMQAVASDEAVGHLLIEIGNARAAAGVPIEVSVLRIIDVVIWMRQHGWTTDVSARTGGCACEFQDFELGVGETG